MPLTTRQASKIENVKYRIIGAEFYQRGRIKFKNCIPATVIVYIKGYKEGDYHKLATVLNDFQIFELDRYTKYNDPDFINLDSLMYCKTFNIFVCKKNVVKGYDCSDGIFVEPIRYRRLNEDEFCLISYSDSGKKECFDFKWKPKNKEAQD